MATFPRQLSDVSDVSTTSSHASDTSTSSSACSAEQGSVPRAVLTAAALYLASAVRRRRRRRRRGAPKDMASRGKAAMRPLSDVGSAVMSDRTDPEEQAGAGAADEMDALMMATRGTAEGRPLRAAVGAVDPREGVVQCGDEFGGEGAAEGAAEGIAEANEDDVLGALAAVPVVEDVKAGEGVTVPKVEKGPEIPRGEAVTSARNARSDVAVLDVAHGAAYTRFASPVCIRAFSSALRRTYSGKSVGSRAQDDDCFGENSEDSLQGLRLVLKLFEDE